MSENSGAIPEVTKSVPDQSPGPERVTVNLTTKAATALREAVDRTGYSKTDIINRALISYEFIEGIMNSGGAIYARESPTSDLERLRFL